MLTYSRNIRVKEEEGKEDRKKDLSLKVSLLKTLKWDVYLRCETFSPDWKVCKHRCGVRHSQLYFLLRSQQ